jgi:hypothetical protein
MAGRETVLSVSREFDPPRRRTSRYIAQKLLTAFWRSVALANLRAAAAAPCVGEESDALAHAIRLPRHSLESCRKLQFEHCLAAGAASTPNAWARPHPSCLVMKEVGIILLFCCVASSSAQAIECGRTRWG